MILQLLKTLATQVDNRVTGIKDNYMKMLTFHITLDKIPGNKLPSILDGAIIVNLRNVFSREIVLIEGC